MTTNEEKDLFRKAMADVSPLKHTPRAMPERPRPRRQRRAELGQPSELSTFPLSDSEPLQAWETPSGHIFWQRSSLRPREVRRLKRGEFSKAWQIDLHGMTRDEAARALHRFVSQAHQAGARHLLIITGKGYHSEGGESVVRKVAQQTLEHLPMVLAFTSAQPADGGTGAFYVFLRAGD